MRISHYLNEHKQSCTRSCRTPAIISQPAIGQSATPTSGTCIQRLRNIRALTMCMIIHRPKCSVHLLSSRQTNSMPCWGIHGGMGLSLGVHPW